MSAEIQFHIGVGIKAPISEGAYEVGHTKINVHYPTVIDLGFGLMPLPHGLSTVFIVAWLDDYGDDSKLTWSSKTGHSS